MEWELMIKRVVAVKPLIGSGYNYEIQLGDATQGESICAIIIPKVSTIREMGFVPARWMMWKDEFYRIASSYADCVVAENISSAVHNLSGIKSVFKDLLMNAGGQ